MDLADIPLFSMLKSRMSYLNERQRVISENVANADSAGYSPHDLKPFSFQAQVQAASGVAAPGMMAATQAGHMQLGGGRGSGGSGSRLGGAKTVTIKDSETTLDGNSVVLEEEMMKMTDARMNYEAAVNFYQHSLNMLRTATRAPGK